MIRGVRDGRVEAGDGTLLSALAAGGLDDRVAGVELGNVLRPTVAVSWLGVHAAVALDAIGPDHRAALADGDDALRRAFAHEVRRTTPFVPALAGRARRAVEHTGVALDPGDRVVLDVRGINLDPARHDDPHTFRADRFLGREPGPYEIVPQGGGPPTGHRCPGESLTVALLAETVGVLAGVSMRLPRTRVDLRRMPTLPEAGLRITVAW